jgi:hypothetical protein
MGVRKMFQELEEVPMTMVGGFDVHPQQITFDYVDDEGLVHQSAGKSKSKGRGRGNPWLAGALGRIAFANSRADTFLGARYRRLARRRGKQKAIVATGNSVLTGVYPPRLAHGPRN